MTLDIKNLFFLQVEITRPSFTFNIPHNLSLKTSTYIVYDTPFYISLRMNFDRSNGLYYQNIFGSSFPIHLYSCFPLFWKAGDDHLSKSVLLETQFRNNSLMYPLISQVWTCIERLRSCFTALIQLFTFTRRNNGFCYSSIIS